MCNEFTSFALYDYMTSMVVSEQKGSLKKEFFFSFTIGRKVQII